MSGRRVRDLQARNNAPDTPAAIEWRVRHNAVLEQVRGELKQKFPVLTSANVGDALDWQTARIAELMK